MEKEDNKVIFSLFFLGLLRVLLGGGGL